VRPLGLPPRLARGRFGGTFRYMPDPPKPSSPRAEHLQLALGAGLALAVLFTTQLYIWVNWWPLTIGWGTAALWSLPQMAVWIAEIGIVRYLALRWPIEPPHRNRKILVHGLLSIVFALGGLALLDISDRTLHWSVGIGAPSSIISNLKYTIIHLHMGIGVYWVSLAVTQAAVYQGTLGEEQERVQSMAGELAQAKLTTLRSQLSPHFLFNTLNGIAVAVRENPEAAETMVYRLSEFLRLTLETSELAEVSVDEELAAIGAYLAIEQVRFGSRLQVTIESGNDVASCLVPTLLLQPLVENAVRHGMTPRTGAGSVRVRVDRQGGNLRIMVRDAGPGPSEVARPEGVGLRNTRRRLQTHYGDKASFSLRAHPEGGAEAAIEIPVHYETARTGART
jgi:two-component system LytT family sensor kinase